MHEYSIIIISMIELSMADSQTKSASRRNGARPAAERRRRASAAESIGLPTTVVPEDGAPPLPRVPALLARRFQQVCASMIGDAIAGEGIVQVEYASLIALEIEPGIDQRRLGDAIGIDPSNASLVVDRLHSMGLIERRINGVDRRARELYLTTKGKALWRRARVKGKVANAKVIAPLAPHERELFLDMLIRVIQGNWAHARPGGGRRKRSSSQTSKT
ncbi:MAG: MarR family transcriptional regulator [Rhizobiales bacterium]|nr:MarR family transcriptional regulator [Hyphomicrobiales bacterium]